MKVLFAVNDEKISESIIKRYQKDYKEIISSKNVYYFNAILKEIQKDKSYDRIIISEELEPFSNNNYDAIDKFLFEKLDRISDEAFNLEGINIPIIFIGSDRRTRPESLLVKLFGIGIYDVLVGQDRVVEKVCSLLNKPRSKKEAKIYYKIDADNIEYKMENEDDLSEIEIQNILAHYKKIGKNEEKYVSSFDSIASQYTDEQLKVIINFLPKNVTSVLENKSPKYRQVMNIETKKITNNRGQGKNDSNSKIELIEKELTKQRLTKPVIIPTSVDANKVKKRIITKVEPENELEVKSDNKVSKYKETKNENVEDLQKMIDEIEENSTVKRGRGRPPKKKDDLPNIDSIVQDSGKKKRGRPSKKSIEKVEDNELKIENNKIENENVQNRKIDKRSNKKHLNEEQENDEFEDISFVDLDDDEVVEVPEYDDDDVIELPEEDEELVELPEEDDDDGIEILDEDDDEEEIPEYDEEEEIELPDDDNDEEEELVELPEYDDDEEVELPEDEDEEEELVELPEYDEDDEEEEVELPDDDEVDKKDNSNDSDFDDFYSDDDLIDLDEEQNDENEFDTNKISKIETVEPISNPNFKKLDPINNSTSKNVEKINNSGLNLSIDSLISSNQKLVSFVGTSKNGTSFLVNNLAIKFSEKGINTAILDLTTNRNAYYIFTDNREELREISNHCIEKLRNGVAEGIKVNKNLTVFTSLPDEVEGLNDYENIIQTLLNNYSIVLLDCDFNTNYAYFNIAQEVYLVQSFDILTIQPLTAFLRELKAKNILNPNKLRVIINKHVKLSNITDKLLIGGISSYNDPGMSFMTELFNKNEMKYFTVPFDIQAYEKYLNGLADCKVSLRGYSKNMLQSLEKLANQVFPLINGKSNYKENGYNNYNKNKF